MCDAVKCAFFVRILVRDPKYRQIRSNVQFLIGDTYLRYSV